MSDHDPSQATKEWIDVKLSGFRSEMRMLFILSVAGNQVLAHLSFAPALSYIGGGVAFGVAVLVKIGLVIKG